MAKRKEEALMNEIKTLWINGYGEALSYWADREVRLYKQGLLIGALIFCGWGIAAYLRFRYTMAKNKT